MVLPEWARQATAAEDAYVKKRQTYNQMLGGLMVAIAVAALAMEASRLFSIGTIEVVTLVCLLFLIVLIIAEDELIKPPQTPSYQRLGAALCLIAENLGIDGRASKEDLKEQSGRASSLIAYQQPEFEEKDLVFGIAVSVLKKLSELMQRIKSASESNATRSSLAAAKDRIRALADAIYSTKTINDSNIEIVADAALSSMRDFPVQPTVSASQQLTEWIVQRSARETFFIEIPIALFIASLGTILFRITIFDGIILFLAALSVLVLTEDRVFRANQRRP